MLEMFGNSIFIKAKRSEKSERNGSGRDQAAFWIE
jgi:hypothetical protein